MRIDVLFGDGQETLILSPDQAGHRLTEILRSANLPLNTRCGERDMCAGCTIELVTGSLKHVDGSVLASPEEFRACRYTPIGNCLTLRIPQRARLAYAPQVLDHYRINVPYARDPLAAEGLGVSIDIGTTTVALQVLDLASGQIVGKASGFNKQMHFGDDVLTRINLCLTDPDMLPRLQAAIVRETIQPLIVDAGIDAGRIACFALSGNTTMLHLVVGADPSAMGVAPFTPLFLEKGPFRAGEMGLEPFAAAVYMLPSISAYIGADLTAGLFASGLLYDEGPSLLVDVGTNGEILLRYNGETSGCATAAGPAFEGCGLTCGIRAGEGAISHVRIGSDSTVEWERIGPPGKPTGICGSAYIDFLAEGRRAGLLGPTGRFQGFGEELPHGRAIRLAHGQGKRPICVTEHDVARLLQAKAAIAAGILTLLQRYDLGPQDVKTLFLAGGFGMHLDLASAIGCGLLPGFSADQIQLVGNTSLAGATLALVDKNTLAELSRATAGVKVVELNLNPSFEDTYVDQLGLP